MAGGQLRIKDACDGLTRARIALFVHAVTHAEDVACWWPDDPRGHFGNHGDSLLGKGRFKSANHLCESPMHALQHNG